MLRVYFDESGHPADSPVVSVAGVVSTEQGWCAFEEQWEVVLKRYRVCGGLHMKDYAHRRGEFSGWTDGQREQFARELVSILRQHVCFGFECSLPMAHWNEVMRDKLVTRLQKRGPLMFLFRCCLDAIQETNLLPQEEPIACQFESNEFIVGAATTTFEEWRKEFGQQNRFPQFGFLQKGTIHGLEAADLLAYEGRKELLEGYVKENGRPSRQLYESLNASTKFQFMALTKDGLMSYLKAEFPDLLSDEEMQRKRRRP